MRTHYKTTLLTSFFFLSDLQAHSTISPYVGIAAAYENNRLSESIQTEDVAFGIFGTTNTLLPHNKRKVAPRLTLGLRAFLEEETALSFEVAISPPLKNKTKTLQTMPPAGLTFSEALKRRHGLHPTLKVHHFLSPETNIFFGAGLSLEKYKIEGSLTRNVGINIAFKEHFTLIHPSLHVGAEHAVSEKIWVSGSAQYKLIGTSKRYVRQHINPATRDIYKSSHHFKGKASFSFGLQFTYHL